VETTTEDVLRRVLELLQQRGWTVKFSNGPDTPLNLRCAISCAAREMTGGNSSEWNRLYVQTTQLLHDHLKDGISSWEFGTHADPPRRRRQAEVESMLSELLGRIAA